MRNRILKNKTDSNENDFKLINEKYYLYDKSNDLKKRNINSANPNKFDKKNNFKKIYILSKSENKKHNNNNNTFFYGKNQLKFNIKNTPFQQKFTLIEQMNKTSIDNYFPKLLPKNIFNNNSNEDRYFHFLKKNKTNYSIQNENNKNNNNIINFRTIINSFIKIKNSKNDFYNNIKMIFIIILISLSIKIKIWVKLIIINFSVQTKYVELLIVVMLLLIQIMKMVFLKTK